MITNSDALRKPLVTGNLYGFSSVSNGISCVAQCTFQGTFTLTGLARVIVACEDVYCGGTLPSTVSSKSTNRTIQPFLLFPLCTPQDDPDWR